MAAFRMEHMASVCVSVWALPFCRSSNYVHAFSYSVINRPTDHISHILTTQIRNIKNTWTTMAVYSSSASVSMYVLFFLKESK